MVNGFPFFRLTQMWDSLKSDSPEPSVTLIIDDWHSQVMQVQVNNGAILVSRLKDGDWELFDYLGDTRFSQSNTYV